MVQTTYYDLNAVMNGADAEGNFGHVARQLLTLHRLASQHAQPTVMECGVHRGWSTGVLALACEDNDGRLVSVDINDCSDAVVSDHWHFIQSDDTQREAIFAQAPHLRAGIDLLYIDSLHAAAHVRQLIALYYPFVKDGGYLAFDDVDPGPYLRGGPKDDAEREIAWRGIQQTVLDFFYANQDHLRLQIHYGSTGLAVIEKRAPLGHTPSLPAPTPRRYTTLKSLAKRWLGR